MGNVSLYEDILDRLYEDLAAELPREEVESEVLRLAKRVPIQRVEFQRAKDEDLSRPTAKEQFRHVVLWALRKAKQLEVENDRLRRELNKAEAKLRRLGDSEAQMAAANERLGRKLAKIRKVLDKQ